MKKVLLGTTALVAAGAFAGIGAAQAQDMMAEPISINVGGYYNIALVSTDVDGAMNNRGHGFQQNIELEGGGSVVLDNGITAGVRIRINGNNGGPHAHGDSGMPTEREDADADGNAISNTVDEHVHGAGDMGGANNNIDEAEVFFTGAFGSLHLGMIEGAGYQTQIWAPGGGPIGGIKSSFFGGSGDMAAWGDSGLMDDDSTKVLYFSPTFNGVSFAISYAPEDSTTAYAGDGDADGGNRSSWRLQPATRPTSWAAASPPISAMSRTPPKR